MNFHSSCLPFSSSCLCVHFSMSFSTTHLLLSHCLPFILSTLLPRLRSLMNIKRRAAALFAVRLTSNTLLSALPQAPLKLLFHLFFLNSIFPCNYFPMNISSLLNDGASVCGGVRVRTWTSVFMSSFTDT